MKTSTVKTLIVAVVSVSFASLAGIGWWMQQPKGDPCRDMFVQVTNAVTDGSTGAAGAVFLLDQARRNNPEQARQLCDSLLSQ